MGWGGGMEEREPNCDYYDLERSSEKTLFELLWLTGFTSYLVSNLQAYGNEFQATRIRRRQNMSKQRSASFHPIASLNINSSYGNS
jgi:hypothetical protein